MYLCVSQAASVCDVRSLCTLNHCNDQGIPTSFFSFFCVVIFCVLDEVNWDVGFAELVNLQLHDPTSKSVYITYHLITSSVSAFRGLCCGQVERGADSIHVKCISTEGSVMCYIPPPKRISCTKSSECVTL